jgi:hypothetical protein
VVWKTYILLWCSAGARGRGWRRWLRYLRGHGEWAKFDEAAGEWRHHEGCDAGLVL